MKKASNEIDLLELLAKIYFLFKRNKYIILTFAVIGLTLGILKSSKTEAYYQTEMITKTSVEPDAVYNRLQTLSDFRSNNNVALLAEELNIAKEDATQIKRIEVEKVEEREEKEEKEERENFLLRITLEVHNNKIIPKISKGLINYTQSNDFLNQQLKNKQKHFELYLNKISEALKIIQRKEKQKINSEKYSESILLGEESYASQIIQLMDKKEKIEKSLSQNKPLNIIKDFHIPENKQRDTTIKIPLYFAIGLFAGIVIVICLSLIKKFESLRKNQNI